VGDTLRRVRRLLALMLFLTLVTPAAAAQPKTTLPDVEDEVMCVVCGTALNVSTAPSADQERAFIRARIREGKTKAQIKAAMVKEYGPSVIATPDQGGFDVAAWLVPALLVALALLAVILAVRRWRSGGGPGGRGPDQPAVAGLSPADSRRLDAELREFDR
jgi:cytochrome c-type biogenesis protein CcmH